MRHPLDKLPDGVNRNGEHDFNFADARGMVLRKASDEIGAGPTLIMERTSFGWRFRMGWGLCPPFELWYDPDIQENT